ncbi:hypothetical protein AMS68_001933 [Peltaster fructicola]|uniref:Peroxisomal membrane protein PEX13 n=1 Tax=Peltaster fructicola TaxID=286661 RepID=A0A6H0XP07_9PEZI|nr:hypothetical protein AMS68_001933 [Peltaster fructicola]
MSGSSPPKPWERPGAGSTSAALPVATTTPSAATTNAAAAPAIPSRPDSLNALAARNASTYSSPYARASPYGSGVGGIGGMYGSSYGGYGGGYSSPYNRFGGGYSSMYGSGYGYGGGAMYGQPGMYGQGQDQSLTNQFSQSTQTTFQMIESIVGAFGGFAQMLESTYMATHSSFFAMVSVAEQFGNLKETLGSILGVFALLRWFRTGMAKITGRPLPADSQELTPANFAAFNGGKAGPDGRPKPSRTPFVLFVVAVFGLPYLMGKLVKTLAASQEAQQQRELQNQQPIDPNKLDFCRVIYDYSPQMGPGQQFQEGVDIEVKKGDYIAVLSKTDPMGQPSEWWQCRARDGRIGYLPSPYLEAIQRRPQNAQISDRPASAHSSPVSSRVNTMTSKAATEPRANSMKITGKEKATVPAKLKPRMPDGRPNDISVESFQRGGFYS